MVKLKCKLCPRPFPDGRELGGNMKSHFITICSNPTQQLVETELTESAFSFSSFNSSSFEDEVEEQEHNKSLVVYGLRENPKRSFKLQDPKFASCLDKENESRNPTRKRSKWTRKECNKVILVESEQQLSSVTYTSTEEELAMCLLLLSEDTHWTRRNDVNTKEEEEEDRKKENKKVFLTARKDKLRCEKCMKRYRSSRALSAHKRICLLNITELRSRSNINGQKVTNNVEESIFQCPYCYKLFGSGQALGGHKRSHLVAASSSSSSTIGRQVVGKFEVKVRGARKSSTCRLIDLNLPASTEEEESKVVSD